MQYWYNTETGQVEEDSAPDRAQMRVLMGPYASREEAEQAYAKAGARTEAWDEEDAREEEWRTGDADARNWDANPLNDND